LHKSRIISPMCLRTFPYSAFLRYLGTKTMWYLQSHLICDRLRRSCIGSSSRSQQSSPGGGVYLFAGDPGTVKPFHAHGQRPWFTGFN
jgi:hypothetical protein